MAIHKIRLKKQIIVEGLGVCKPGEVVEVNGGVAQHLVGAGLAEHAVDGQDRSAMPYGVHVETPDNRDPKPRRVTDGPKGAKPAPAPKVEDGTKAGAGA